MVVLMERAYGKSKVKGRDCPVDRTNRSPGRDSYVNWFCCWMSKVPLGFNLYLDKLDLRQDI